MKVRHSKLYIKGSTYVQFSASALQDDISVKVLVNLVTRAVCYKTKEAGDKADCKHLSSFYLRSLITVVHCFDAPIDFDDVTWSF